MAYIGSYQTARGKRYRVRYRTPEGSHTDRRGFKTKAEAKSFAAEVEVSKLKGEYVSPTSARATVGDLGEAWLDRQKGHLKPTVTGGQADKEASPSPRGASTFGRIIEIRRTNEYMQGICMRETDSRITSSTFIGVH
jgi:hypothetical protein